MLKKAVILFLLPMTQAAAQEAIRLPLGASARVQFPENPSTGYSWTVDRTASERLELVAIVDGGHIRGRKLPGAPGTHVWTVRARHPGQARIFFVYQRPWEKEPVDTREVTVDISR